MATKHDEGQLELVYLPLSKMALWEHNAKLHDLPALIDAFRIHGFHDPPKIDANLNDGQGAVVFGNGRITALTMMREEGMEPPAGIVEVDELDGEPYEWMVPILKGLDGETEAKAEALAIDHNNQVVLGGDVTPFFSAGLWDPERYAAALKRVVIDAGEQLTTLEEDDARSLAANLVLQTRLRTRPALNQLDADGNIARVVVQIGTYRSMVEKDRFFAWKEKVEAQAEEQGTSVKRLIWQLLKLADFMDFDEAAELTKSAADDEEEE